MGSKILLAEDNPDLMEALRTELADKGYEILAVDNGDDALRAALSEPLDLLLLDVMMPGMSGYHVALEVTSKLGAQAPPILIMTGRIPGKDANLALLSGAVEVLHKPFSMAKLGESVAKALRGKRD